MKKKILSLLLVLALSLGLAVPAMAAGNPFADVAADAYYAEAVAWAVERGVTSGTSATTFSPDDICTRGEIITFLWRSAGSPAPSATGGVGDIQEGDYFYQAVLWAKENGMFEGDFFQPNAPCTRLMAVEFLWQTAGAPVTRRSGFTDVASDAVNWAVARGITSGTSATAFSPDDRCTRGQIVTFLWRNAAFEVVDGTYVREDGRYYLELTYSGHHVGADFYKIYSDGGEGKTAYAKLIPNQSGPLYSAQWNGFILTFYKDYLVATFQGAAAEQFPLLGGTYIRKTD